ncbi:PREDICTED: ankyrin-2-like [Priapulus caudatus]|uniref:Ankyrin-2-like n=1 Tax=Priapulus caudatus TaxID=37621 RepID=A0ABM1DSW6_PRICU|nr:PREDICTED: ankyrin-2-like [Priapulus caudatus]
MSDHEGDEEENSASCQPSMTFMEAYDDTCSTVGQAARTGNLPELKRLIKMKRPVDVQDNRGWRAIHEAAAANHGECLAELLKHPDTDMHWQSFERLTPLHVACKSGSLDCVRLLLAGGADPDIATSDDTTPLLDALYNKEAAAEIVKALLKSGASANAAIWTKWTPLHEAGIFQHKSNQEITRLLLDHGATLQAPDENGLTPVFTAAQHGNTDCLRTLLDRAEQLGEAGVVNKAGSDGATPLFIAAQEGFLDCIELLLSHGADANAALLDETAVPLVAAIQQGHVRVVERLLGETSAEALRTRSASPYHMAIDWSRLDCLRALAAHGLLSDEFSRETRLADAVGRDDLAGFYAELAPDRVSPLAHALSRGARAMTLALLAAGANANAFTPRHVPPLLAALATPRVDDDIVAAIVDAGAQLNGALPGGGDASALYLAACLAQPGKLRLLLRRGLDARVLDMWREDDGSACALCRAGVTDALDSNEMAAAMLIVREFHAVFACPCSKFRLISRWSWRHLARLRAACARPPSLAHAARVRLRRRLPLALLARPDTLAARLREHLPAQLVDFVLYNDDTRVLILRSPSSPATSSKMQSRMPTPACVAPGNLQQDAE